ncbi:MAG: flagellar biosynthetic protein FliO [Chlamydiota bacterium]
MLKLKCCLVFLLSIFAIHAEEINLPPPATDLTTAEVQQAAPISYEGAFVKMALTLGGLLVLIFLTIFVLRRLGRGRLGGNFSSRSIKVLERRALSPKSVLYLVEIGGKQVVIAESQLEVRRITTLDSLASDD